MMLSALALLTAVASVDVFAFNGANNQISTACTFVAPATFTVSRNAEESSTALNRQSHQKYKKYQKEY
eukprot:2064643-Ditylum_brightwellii.AAC.1